MLQKLLDVLQASNQKKIHFPDEIKVTTKDGLIYISEIKEVLGNWMIKIQYRKSVGFRNIKDVDEAIVSAIATHVNLFVNNKRKVA